MMRFTLFCYFILRNLLVFFISMTLNNSSYYYGTSTCPYYSCWFFLFFCFVFQIPMRIAIDTKGKWPK